jgi:ABC-type multidrug transport system permease subunit
MKNVFFIVLHDLRYQIRQGSTLLWVFVMPPIFFYFIGTVTGGFTSSVGGSTATALVVEAKSPGFIQAQIDKRLRENDFSPTWVTSIGEIEDSPGRTLRFQEGLSGLILAGEQSTSRFETSASSILRDFEAIRIQRSLYTVLADVAVADGQSDQALSAEALLSLNAQPRIWQLEVSPAGNRKKIPSGFEQSIPGILVMFTLLVLLTSGASMLAVERNQGLLRRLAWAPISRLEIVAGKWGGRMALAAVQITVALIFGTYLFGMDWGPNLGMVIVVLGAWAAFCASAGLLLGSIASTEAQAAGLGVLLANLLAALGGCWWPIEITPSWMQFLQKLLPTGWTMDALHKLISFEAGAMSAAPNVVVLVVAALAVTMFAVRKFRYE